MPAMELQHVLEQIFAADIPVVEQRSLARMAVGQAFHGQPGPKPRPKPAQPPTHKPVPLPRPNLDSSGEVHGNPAVGEKALDDKTDKVSIEKKKTALKNSFSRIEKIQVFIGNRQSEEIKSVLTLQTDVMRANMEYLSGDRDSAALAKVCDFFHDVADIGVGARDKRWPLAQGSYDKAKDNLAAWKAMVGF